MPTMDKTFEPVDAAALGRLIEGSGGTIGGTFGKDRYGERDTYSIRTGHVGYTIAMLLLERARAILAKFSGDETGWLIELVAEGEPPMWFTLNHGGLSRDYGFCWTPTAERALRFARREDADAFMAANQLDGAKQRFGQAAIKATEHAWTNGKSVVIANTNRDGAS